MAFLAPTPDLLRFMAVSIKGNVGWEGPEVLQKINRRDDSSWRVGLNPLARVVGTSDPFATSPIPPCKRRYKKHGIDCATKVFNGVCKWKDVNVQRHCERIAEGVGFAAFLDGAAETGSECSFVEAVAGSQCGDRGATKNTTCALPDLFLISLPSSLYLSLYLHVDMLREFTWR